MHTEITSVFERDIRYIWIDETAKKQSTAFKVFFFCLFTLCVLIAYKYIQTCLMGTSGEEDEFLDCISEMLDLRYREAGRYGGCLDGESEIEGMTTTYLPTYL